MCSFAAFTGNSSDTSSRGTIRRSAPAQPFLPKLIKSQGLIEKIVDIGALAGGPAKSVPLTNTQVNADLTMVVKKVALRAVAKAWGERWGNPRLTERRLKKT
jgi:hypothetical protein